VRRFGCFTADLREMAQWLVEKGVRSVAMQSTGVYWMPVFEGTGFNRENRRNDQDRGDRQKRSARLTSARNLMLSLAFLCLPFRSLGAKRTGSPGVYRGTANLAEGGRIQAQAVTSVVPQCEIGVVEQVEKLGPELQTPPLR